MKLGSATISSQSIGVASSSVGFNGTHHFIRFRCQCIDGQFLPGFDGIIGIGPTDLTGGTTSGGGTIPTVTDNLASQRIVDHALVGVSFVPTISLNDQNGELDFGVADRSKFFAPPFFVPITSTSPASTFWGIDQTVMCVSISLFQLQPLTLRAIFASYGLGNVILPSTAGIVDTGV